MGMLEEAEGAREHGLLLWREKLCLLYIEANERADFDTLAAIWAEAEQDEDLCEMLIEIDEALHVEMLAEHGETPEAYAQHIAALAGRWQKDVALLTALRQAEQGECSCGRHGMLYILLDAASPTKRCITCWQQHGEASKDAPA